MWTVNVEPVVTYFLFLPVDNEVLYTEGPLTKWGIPDKYYGDLSTYFSNVTDTVFIPIDPHLAISLEWVDAKTMMNNMEYINPTMRAAFTLVADVVVEEEKEK